MEKIEMTQQPPQQEEEQDARPSKKKTGPICVVVLWMIQQLIYLIIALSIAIFSTKREYNMIRTFLLNYDVRIDIDEEMYPRIFYGLASFCLVLLATFSLLLYAVLKQKTTVVLVFMIAISVGIVAKILLVGYSIYMSFDIFVVMVGLILIIFDWVLTDVLNFYRKAVNSEMRESESTNVIFTSTPTLN